MENIVAEALAFLVVVVIAVAAVWVVPWVRARSLPSLPRVRFTFRYKPVGQKKEERWEESCTWGVQRIGVTMINGRPVIVPGAYGETTPGTMPLMRLLPETAVHSLRLGDSELELRFLGAEKVLGEICLTPDDRMDLYSKKWGWAVTIRAPSWEAVSRVR